MNNLIRLAQVFEKFIELESSFVEVDEIKAIRKTEKGIEVITPYGTFEDSTKYDTFKTRIADMTEVLQQKNSDVVSRNASEARVPTPSPDQSQRKIVPLSEPAPQRGPEAREVTIDVSASGAKGLLFADENLKVVSRDTLRITDRAGNVVAEGSKGGTLSGETLSGIIFENGKYNIAFKNFADTAAIVHFSVQPR